MANLPIDRWKDRSGELSRRTNIWIISLLPSSSFFSSCSGVRCNQYRKTLFFPPLSFVSRKSVTWRCIEIFVHRQLCHWYVTKHHRHVAGRWMRVYRQIWKHCTVENFSNELQIQILTITWLTLVSLNGKTFDVSREFLYVTLECQIALSIRILLLYLQTWNVFLAIECERYAWIENSPKSGFKMRMGRWKWEKNKIIDK